jgi:preprotein translocase subunit SecA
MADFELHKRGLDPVDNLEDYEREWDAELIKQRNLVTKEHDIVVSLGGLYVLGTERHESRRIDNQLRGRSGRQGDPGESRFYLSLEDDLMLRFNSGLVSKFLSAANFPEDQPIEAKMVSNAIKSAQTQIESMNFEMRKNILKYDDVMNSQRTVIYNERNKILSNTFEKDEAFEFLVSTIKAYTFEMTNKGYPEEWDLDKFRELLSRVYPTKLDFKILIENIGGLEHLDYKVLEDAILLDLSEAVSIRNSELSDEVSRLLDKAILLSVIDEKWRNHLYEMDYLKEGIGLRAMAQRDPLVEYQKEGYMLFNAMIEEIKEEVAYRYFRMKVITEKVNKPANLNYNKNVNNVNNNLSVSRNSQCPCGSGKKYKRCHGDIKVSVK